MTIGSRKASVFLFVGDIIVFAVSLWLTLFIRYGTIPSETLLASHAGPFAFLFGVWALVFFMGGLYEKRTIFFKRDVSGRIIRTQGVNIVLAALFFFFVPALGITPKTNLFIYMVVSLLGILTWRILVFPKLAERRTQTNAVIIGSGSEVEELRKELNGNARYGIACHYVADPHVTTTTSLMQFFESPEGMSTQLIIADTRDSAVALLTSEIYTRIASRQSYQIIDMLAFYEEVFDRVPLTRLSNEWFFRYANRRVSEFYLVTKRCIDIVGGLVMAVVTIIITPGVWAALRLEGKGPVFIAQHRIGERERSMRAYKFRTMSMHDAVGAWVGENNNHITRVGAFLRRTSLDEFPQFINILRGELSLVGPRNDIEGLGKRLKEALPYYNVRYTVKPGITGWAQVNQQYEPGNLSPQSIEETKMRLAYDFYYLKHRSLMLDVIIALKTIKRMFFRLAP